MLSQDKDLPSVHDHSPWGVNGQRDGHWHRGTCLATVLWRASTTAVLFLDVTSRNPPPVLGVCSSVWMRSHESQAMLQWNNNDRVRLLSHDIYSLHRSCVFLFLLTIFYVCVYLRWWWCLLLLRKCKRYSDGMATSFIDHNENQNRGYVSPNQEFTDCRTQTRQQRNCLCVLLINVFFHWASRFPRCSNGEVIWLSRSSDWTKKVAFAVAAVTFVTRRKCHTGSCDSHWRSVSVWQTDRRTDERDKTLKTLPHFLIQQFHIHRFFYHYKLPFVHVFKSIHPSL